MGMVRIELVGSFSPQQSKAFSAMSYGHAAAIAEAIAWLSDECLPWAIKQDHELQAKGIEPEHGFGI